MSDNHGGLYNLINAHEKRRFPMTNQCTCTIDKEATCIVHPTTRSLKERIAELEEENTALLEVVNPLRCGCQLGTCGSKVGFICRLSEEIAAIKAGTYERAPPQRGGS